MRSACVAAALLGFAAAQLAGATPASASNCPNVLYIGAAGSGELEPSADPSRYDYMGPEVNHMAEVMKTRLAQRGLTLNNEPVNYSASSVNVLVPSTFEDVKLVALGLAGGGLLYAHDNVQPYINSIEEGVNATIAEATSAAKTCPGTSLVLAGYSQGAIAVHQAELQMPKSVLSHVAGTLLLADGDRVPKTAAKTFGNAPSGEEGIVTYLEGWLGPFITKPAEVPMPATTASICNAEDIVCDFAWKLLGNAGHAAKVHTSYKTPGPGGTYTYSPLLTEAAEWLANKIAPGAGRITFSPGPGTGPPPSTLGPYTMTPFGADEDTPGTEVTSLPDPAGTLTFTPALEDATLGTEWLTWSNDYSGDVYWTDGGGDTATIGLPSGTDAFYFYAEPNEFADYDVRATAANGTTTGELTVYGDEGASYFGFYVNSGAPLTSITITSTDEFAIGEFGISR